MAIRKEPGKCLKGVVVLSSSFWQISYIIIKKEILKTQNIKCKHLLPLSDHYLPICSTWNFSSRFILLMTKIKKAAWKYHSRFPAVFPLQPLNHVDTHFELGDDSWEMAQNWVWRWHKIKLGDDTKLAMIPFTHFLGISVFLGI